MHNHFYRQADRLMLCVVWLMALYALGLAFWHATWAAALISGGRYAPQHLSTKDINANTRSILSLRPAP